MTIVAGLPPAVDSWSGDLATIAAIVVSLGVLLHRRSPLRKMLKWLFRRNIGEPIVQAFEASIVRVIDRKVTPQIERLDTKVEDLAKLNDEQHGETASALEDLKTKLAEHILANPGLPEVGKPRGPGRPRYGQ